MHGDEWLEAHRAAIEEVIASETEQARLAQRLIAEVRVAVGTRTVTIDQFDYIQGTVDDQTTIAVEVSDEDVAIPKLQIDDPDLARALVAIRRSAQQLARQHDDRVFRKELANAIETANPRDPQQKDPQTNAVRPISSSGPSKRASIRASI